MKPNTQNTNSYTLGFQEIDQTKLALGRPRVITSDGEIIAGDYRREDLPVGWVPEGPNVL
jgi:hypothetical protein